MDEDPREKYDNPDEVEQFVDEYDDAEREAYIERHGRNK